MNTKIRRLKGSNAVNLQPQSPTTAAATNDNITHYARWRPTRTTSFRRCQTAAAAGILHVAACRVYSMHVNNTLEDGFFSLFLFRAAHFSPQQRSI